MAFPKLRFKNAEGAEFTSWVTSFIGDECKITTGNKDTQNKIDGGKYPFFVRSQTVERINTYSKDCEAILTSGDGVGVGKNYHYINGKFDFHQRVYCLYDFSNQLLGKYLYIYFSNYFFDRVKRLSAKNSVDSVRMDMISKMEIKLLSLEEQTKIASFLSNVDEKISQLTQKHQLLSQYKQGMMQKLFSQQIRFKADDGSEFGEWEEKTLGSLGVFKSGQGFPEKYQGGKTGVPFFKVSDMNTYGNEKRMVVANNYVDADSILEMKVKVILDESIIFAKVGAAVFLERKRLATNFLIDNNMMAFTPDPKLNINFIKQFLDTIKFSNFVQVGALPSYNAGDLAIIPIHIPCVVEQTKIANFLSAIDQKIDVVAQQIEQTKQWKKGLLQQMFV